MPTPVPQNHIQTPRRKNIIAPSDEGSVVALSRPGERNTICFFANSVSPSVFCFAKSTSLVRGRKGIAVILRASITRLPAQTALLLIVFAEVSTGHPRPRPTFRYCSCPHFDIILKTVMVHYNQNQRLPSLYSLGVFPVIFLKIFVK